MSDNSNISVILVLASVDCLFFPFSLKFSSFLVWWVIFSWILFLLGIIMRHWLLLIPPVLAFCFVLFWDTALAGEWGVLGIEGQAPHLAFAVMGQNWGAVTVLPIVFGYSISVIIQKFSILLGCLFPGPLVRESRLLFLSAPIVVFWITGFSSSKSGICETKRKPRKLTTMSFFGSWGP